MERGEAGGWRGCLAPGGRCVPVTQTLTQLFPHILHFKVIPLLWLIVALLVSLSLDTQVGVG